MTSKGMSEHHRIDYIEFEVTDLAATKQFFSDIFGWKFNDYGPTYAGIVDGDGEVGGFAEVEEVRTGGPLVVLFSEDLSATLKAVRNAGGEITKQPFDFPGGRRFHFLDPNGHELAVWAI